MNPAEKRQDRKHEETINELKESNLNHILKNI